MSVGPSCGTDDVYLLLPAVPATFVLGFKCRVTRKHPRRLCACQVATGAIREYLFVNSQGTDAF